MARGDKQEQVPVRRHNALVAAGTRIKLDDRKAAQKQAAKRQAWQEESWENFDDVPEIKYSTWFLGNAMAKLRLYPAIRISTDPKVDPISVFDPDSGVPADVAQAAQEELDRLKSSLGGQGEILREVNMNLEIAGECYIVGFGPKTVTVKQDDGTTAVIERPEDWDVKSISEVEAKDGKYTIRESPTDQEKITLDPDTDTIFRVWQRHPRWSKLPDCAMRGVLSDCEALLLLTNQVKAEAKSRQGAGVFTVPNELSFGPDSVTEPDGEDNDVDDPFHEELLISVSDPIEDPSSAAAVMPLLIRGPGEFLQPQYLRHFSLSRDTTSVLEERIQKRIERIARGLNLPIEVVLGHQQTTYANAEQVDIDTFEDHLRPRCELLVDCFSVAYLQPQLFDAGVDPQWSDSIIVWYDASALVKAKDVTGTADAAYDRNAISWEAYRRYRGYSEADAPDPIELLIRTGMKSTKLDPNVVVALLDLLGVPIEVEALPTDSTSSSVSTGGDSTAAWIGALLASRNVLLPALQAAPMASATRRISEQAGYKLMQIDREFRSRVHVAADNAMQRALERAGNRLKSKAPTAMKQLVRGKHPARVISTIGPALLADANIALEDLLDGSFDQLESQFMAWGAQAQQQALDVVAKVLGTGSDAMRHTLGARQTEDLGEAWTWLKDGLDTVLHERVFDPSPQAPPLGEFDPTLNVPTGLIRGAVAIAGGPEGLVLGDLANGWVSLTSGGGPVGGIGTGVLLTGALEGGGAAVDGYQWDYGNAFRQNPYDEHLSLDGTIYANFTDDSLSVDGPWPPDGYYMPGDHAGCQCDFIPIVLSPNDLEPSRVVADENDSTDLPVPED